MRFLLRAEGLYIRYHADDAPAVRMRSIPKFQNFVDRINAAKIMVSERCVDNRNPFTVGSIGIGKVASSKPPDAHGGEITGRNHAIVSLWL